MTEILEAALFALLTHPTRPRVLLWREEQGWALPGVHVAGQRVGERDLGIASAKLGEVLGIPTIAYRSVTYRHDWEGERHSVEGVYALEGLGLTDDPREWGSWVGWDELAELKLARPEHRPAIEDVLAEINGAAIPGRRPPWARRGWFATASSWMEERLSTLGYILESPIELLVNWSLSCVLKVTTQRGEVYFKAAATLPLFVDEPRVQAQLARWYPDVVPAPIAIDPTRRWMVTENYGTPLGESGNTLENRLTMIRLVGRLQVESVDRIGELLAMGCPDRRIGRLVEQIDPLIDDPLTVSQLAADDLARLRRSVGTLKAMCQELASYHVPPALVHGDLHEGNVAVREGRIVFFDWTDACVSHPFFDLFVVFGEPDETAQTSLRDTYLAAWTAYEPIQRLREAWALAEKLYGLHHAVSYRSILNNVEPRAQPNHASGLPWAFRPVLRWLT